MVMSKGIDINERSIRKGKQEICMIQTTNPTFMNTICAPVSEMGCIQEAKRSLREGEKPVSIYGASGGIRPLLTEVLREDASQVLIVTYDEGRAQQLYQDYRFYDRNVCVYPSKDVLFYYADVHGNLAARKRLEVVKRLLDGEPTVVIASVESLMDRIPAPETVKKSIVKLKKGQEVSFTDLQKMFTECGYESVGLVEESGQFSTRGGILDIFPLTEECPIRIEFWGDEIESIRAFDASTQRSIEDLEEVEILPATEFVLDDSRRRRGLRRIDDDYQVASDGFKTAGKTEEYNRLKKAVDTLKDDIQNLAGASNVDGLVMYFYPDCVSFLDYFPEDTKIFVDDPKRTELRAEVYGKEFRDAMDSRLKRGYILPRQADILYDHLEILERLEDSAHALFTEFIEKGKVLLPKKELEFVARQVMSFEGKFDELAVSLEKYREEDYRILFISMSQSRGTRLVDTLQEQGIPAALSTDRSRLLQPREVLVATGSLESGFQLPEIKLLVITESDVLRKDKERTRRNRPKRLGKQISHLGELHPGDYVVHERHGIGIYRGIEQIQTDGRYQDYISIEYADGGTLFIPVDHMSMIGKYADAAATPVPKLNKLGSKTWENTKRRVRAQVEAMASELIDLYADRQTLTGHAFPPDTPWQREFEESFPYEETEDQIRAIEDTKRDMESDKIMDRLICGDVGFGKTEVAIRAAFKAVQDGHQVAFLVPTTILAQQHFDTFRKRLAKYPVNIRMLSRFCTPKEIKETLEGIKKSTVDIVVGTHRLLSKDVAFHRLGLLIIDEEQRFGVKHKEKIKQLRNTVDVLTLTATPIPRTMHMSLVGIRDLSLLEEAPVDRRPIQTFVMEYDREMVQEACRRELIRRGQVYYVYNRVDKIASVAEDLAKLLPEARIEYAHGKMSSRELENLMRDFVDKKIDILVTTTIIETGLDIPNVNTIIIHNADRFGLAQLYQLRGRVGRSGRSAYAFLMYQKDKLIKETAEKRLAAIREFTDLGSGYKISMRDLEIRGAGSVLGVDQSGHLEDVGYDLYVKMLSAAIRKKKGELQEDEEEEDSFDTLISLPVNAYIPDVYVRSEYLKLEMYKQIYRVTSEEDADAIRIEMQDRFGDLPKEVENLLKVAVLRPLAHSCGITDIRYENGEVLYLFIENPDINAREIPTLFKCRKGMRIVNGNPAGFKVARSKTVPEDLLEQVMQDVKTMRELLLD